MRSRAVGVAGTRGAPGASFVAAGLACRLAALGVPVLVVDADAQEPSISALLDVHRPATAGSTAIDQLGAVTPEALRGLAFEPLRNLHLLELPPAAGLDGRAVVGAAREAAFGAVVCDLGHEHGALQKQLAAACDWLLWVIEPDRLGLERADRALAAPALHAGSSALVLNRLGPHTLRGAEGALRGRHDLPLMAAIREDRRSAARSTAAHPWHAQRAFRSAFDDLARAVHPDLAGRRRGSWP